MDWSIGVPAPTTTVTLDATMSCLNQQVSFSGTSTTPMVSMCPGAAPATMTFTGTESGDVTGSATWTLVTASGAAAADAVDAAGHQWRGGLTADPSGCSAPFEYGSGAVAQTGGSASAPPDAFLCQVTGAVGPTQRGIGGGGEVDSGPASGAGSCTSAAGIWNVSYTGSWSIDLPNGTTGCPGDYFQVLLTLTNRSTGATRAVPQMWDNYTGGERRPFIIFSGPLPVPFGAAVLQTSPGPCPTPAAMTTTGTLAFFASN